MNLFNVPVFLPWLYPQLTWRIDTSQKDLYLTFDDGPVPGPTEFALEELQKVNARATFFCIGDNVRKFPDVFSKVVDAGHGVGNHTFNHLSGWKASVPGYLENILLCEKQLSESGFQTSAPRLFRPPYGRITRRQIKALREFRIIMWDVLTHDYSQSLSTERCLKGSISAVRPGSIIVFHDSVKASKNMAFVLPRLLDHFSNLGYSFRTLG